MSNLIPCSDFDSLATRCKNGFPRLNPICFGIIPGCPACGRSESKPMCMQEELPEHLIRDDGYPRFWPKEKSE